MKKQNEIKKDLKSTGEELSKYDINSEFDLLAEEEKEEEELEILMQNRHLELLLSAVIKVDFQAVKNPDILKSRAELEKLAKKVLDKNGNAKDDNCDDYKNYLSIKHQISLVKVKFREYSFFVINTFKKIVSDHNYDLKVFEKEIIFYNGKYWKKISEESFANFLKDVSIKMGLVEPIYQHHTFGSDLIKQFIHTNFRQHLVKTNVTAINLQNGTYKFINGKGKFFPHNKNDNLNYILSFSYDENATCPTFIDFLEYVLPEEDKRLVLQEFLGYVFTPNQVINLEKCLLLYGTGHNGKSVINNIVRKIFGATNISVFSIPQITCKQKGEYYAAKLQGKLLNYCSDTRGALEDTGVFKQLVSGETVVGRNPGGIPFDFLNNAKFIFNSNTLPTSTECTNALLRRFEIIEFAVTITADKKDGNLADKIIESELSGVLNWIIIGLNRLMKNKSLSKSQSNMKSLENFKQKLDNVLEFLTEEVYEVVSDIEQGVIFNELYQSYSLFVSGSGGFPLKRTNFRERLDQLTFQGREIRRREKCNGNKHRVNLRKNN